MYYHYSTDDTMQWLAQDKSEIAIFFIVALGHQVNG